MRSILFDLDNTLIHRDKSISHYTEEFVRFYKRLFNRPVDSSWIASKIIEVDDGGYGGHERRCQMLSELAMWRDVPSRQQLLDHWFAWFPSHPIPMSGMIHTLSKLKSIGFKLGIVSNGKSEVQRTKLSALGIISLFDCIVVSGDIGVKKPSPEIFMLALDKLACEPQGAIFVGDHPQNDYIASLNVGMTPIWLSGFREWPEGTEPPIQVVDGLESILEVVQNLTNHTRDIKIETE